MNSSYPLSALLIEVTQKCNARCDQCGSRCDPGGKELLSKNDILNALKDIKENLGTDTMINITGGEPLMREDIFELTAGIKELGFDWGMVSNGSLITDDAIKKMKDTGMKTITISVDGLRETHDSLRHLDGCFDRIITAIKKIRAADFTDHLQVTFTVNRRNVFEFEELYGILNRTGLDSIRVGLMDPIGRAAENRDLLLTREEIIYFTGLVNAINRTKGSTPVIWGCPHFMGELAENRNFTCLTGKRFASILYNGDIYVCPNVGDRARFVQGSILKDSFSEIWKNGFGFFRNLPLPEQCRDCAYKDRCKGDSVHTMDFVSGKPMFCYRDYIESPSPDLYMNSLRELNRNRSFCEISGIENNCREVIIEPEAFSLISEYFHTGRKNPLSMFEQQMALIGFENGNRTVVRYAVPCDGRLRDSDNALFTPGIMKTVKSELGIINRNYFHSSDRSLCGCEQNFAEPMKFLGFIHSHPVQEELCYSTGDERIHRSMAKKYGGYTGILIKPSTGEMGAYTGKEIKQAKLIIPSEVK